MYPFFRFLRALRHEFGDIEQMINDSLSATFLGSSFLFGFSANSHNSTSALHHVHHLNTSTGTALTLAGLLKNEAYSKSSAYNSVCSQSGIHGASLVASQMVSYKSTNARTTVYEVLKQYSSAKLGGNISRFVPNSGTGNENLHPQTDYVLEQNDVKDVSYTWKPSDQQQSHTTMSLSIENDSMFVSCASYHSLNASSKCIPASGRMASILDQPGTSTALKGYSVDDDGPTDAAEVHQLEKSIADVHSQEVAPLSEDIWGDTMPESEDLYAFLDNLEAAEADNKKDYEEADSDGYPDGRRGETVDDSPERVSERLWLKSYNKEHTQSRVSIPKSSPVITQVAVVRRLSLRTAVLCKCANSQSQKTLSMSRYTSDVNSITDSLCSFDLFDSSADLFDSSDMSAMSHGSGVTSLVARNQASSSMQSYIFKSNTKQSVTRSITPVFQSTPKSGRTIGVTKMLNLKNISDTIDKYSEDLFSDTLPPPLSGGRENSIPATDVMENSMIGIDSMENSMCSVDLFSDNSGNISDISPVEEAGSSNGSASVNTELSSSALNSAACAEVSSMSITAELSEPRDVSQHSYDYDSSADLFSECEF